MATLNLKTGESTKYKISQSRIFTELFKREKVEDILNKMISIIEFCKFWNIDDMSVHSEVY